MSVTGIYVVCNRQAAAPADCAEVIYTGAPVWVENVSAAGTTSNAVPALLDLPFVQAPQYTLRITALVGAYVYVGPDAVTPDATSGQWMNLGDTLVYSARPGDRVSWAPTGHTYPPIFTIGAQGTYAERSAYDTEDSGFVYLSLDGDGGLTTSLGSLFARVGATPGVWSDIIPFQGPAGSTGPAGPQGDPGPAGTDGTDAVYSDAIPEDLGTAGPGIAAAASRADHVHDLAPVTDAIVDSVAVYDTVADVGVATVRVGVKAIGTRHYAVVGDGGGWEYMVRVSSEPSHALKVRSIDRFMPDGSTNATHGGWWEYQPSGGRVSVRKFGATGRADFQAKTGPDDTTAFQAAQAYCVATGCDLLIDDYYNVLGMSSTGLVIDSWRMRGIGKYNCGVRVKVGGTDLTGTYSQTSTTVTVTITGHGHMTGDLLYFNATSGAGVDGWFIITVTGVNTFTFTAEAAATTSGSCTIPEFPLNARAITLAGTGAAVMDLEVMAHQWSQRPADRGDLGANIAMGYFGYGAVPSQVVNPCVRDVLLTRAPSTSGDLSYSGVGVMAVGRVIGYSCTRLSYNVTSGVGFSYGVSQHWGCSALDPLGDPGVTYHPHDGTWTFDGPVTGAGVAVGLSSAYNVNIGPFDATGSAQALYILPGDNADAFAGAEDAGRVLRGIRVGMITGRLTGAATGAHGIEIQGQSQSKWQTAGGAPLMRNLDLDIIIEGSDLTYDGTCPASTDAVYVANYRGRIDLGTMKSSGYSRRALYAYRSGKDSTLVYNITESDQGVYISGGGGLDARGNNVEPAWSDSDSGGVTVLGALLTETLASDSAIGATTTTLSAALGDILIPGDIVQIGTNSATITDPTADTSAIVYHTPLLAAAAAGTTFTCEKRPHGTVQANTKGGRYGARFSRCTVAVYGAGPSNSGQDGIRVEAGAIVNLEGAWPQNTGQNSSTTTNYDLYVLAGTHVSIRGSKIGPGPASLEGHIYCETGGSVHIVDAVKDGTTQLWVPQAGGTVPTTVLKDLTVGRLVDTTGVIVEQLGASGATTYQFGGSDANGYWMLHADGTAHCWLRNVSTDAAGTYAWVYPAGIAMSTTTNNVVLATPTSSANNSTAHALSTGVSGATITTWNSAGTKAAIAFGAMVLGRWR